jgi:redox-sensitive bicupin YhaK (pirin superfamily)
MHVLQYEQLDITGFAGIRERVLVSDRRYFKRNVPDEVRDGFGACVYLAHAYFTANGSTGLHHHQGVDIISIFTKGQVLHQGTLGDGEQFSSGDVLVQCSGPNGFRHNEINGLSDISGMVQLWCEPSEQSATHQLYHKLSIDTQGVHRVYGGLAKDPDTKVVNNTQLDLAVLDAGSQLSLRGKVRLYLLQGKAQVSETDATASLKRGTLCDGQNLELSLHEPSRILIQSMCQI